MTDLDIISDARLRPRLFRWNGKMDEVSLRRWLEEHDLGGRCPSGLIAFWEQTGGGDVFESETILGPMGDADLGDDIIALNKELMSRGMPERFLVFHAGLLTSAVDTISGDFVELGLPAFDVVRRFLSFDEWYRETLREEYGVRYGLRSL